MALQLAEGTEERATIIKHVLPRKTQLSRLASGRHRGTPVGSEQLLAANVDTVFIVRTLGHEFSVRRLERYLAAVAASGARPVALLNKADLCDEVETRLKLVQAVALGTAVHTLSALEDSDFSVLDAYLNSGETVVLIGSSGVGKSTLVNRLLGHEAAARGAVREGDGKGRHTTTRREVFILPNGGVLIDNPGLREIGLWADDVGENFTDIAELEAACAYRDCTHGGEPGCAVQAALEEGRLGEGRLHNNRQLRLEAEQVKAWVSDKERFRQETKARKKGIKAARRAKGR